MAVETRRIDQLDPYLTVDVNKATQDLYEVSKNTGTAGSPLYEEGGSRKITAELLKQSLNIQDYFIKDIVAINNGDTLEIDKINNIILSSNGTFALPTASSTNNGKILIVRHTGNYTATITGSTNGDIELININETLICASVYDGVSTYGWVTVARFEESKICSNSVVLSANTHTAKHNENIQANALSIGSDVNITIPSAGIEGRLIYVYYPTGSPSLLEVNLISGFSATLLQGDYFLIRDNGSYWEAISTSQNGGGTSDDITNESTVSGITVTDALDALLANDTTTLNDAKSYADSLIVGLWDDRGNYDASSGSYPSSGGSGTAGAILKGDTWTISVAGTLPTSQVVEVGDIVRSLVNTPGNTQSNWAIQQNNIGYTAENSANKTSTVTGNETSTTLYLSVKGVYDYLVGLVWFTATLIGTKLNSFTAKTTVVDADVITTLDSAASFEAKKTTLSQLWTYIVTKLTSAGYLSGTLTNNVVPASNGAGGLVNSYMTYNSADGGMDINNAYIYARKTTGTYAAYFDFQGNSGSALNGYSQKSKAIYAEANTNRTTTDPASVVINRVSNTELAWFQSFDKDATQRNATSKQNGSIYLQRSGRNSSASDIANDGYNVGIFAQLSPNTTANKDINGSWNFTQVDYVNNKGAWIAYVAGTQVAQIGQDGIAVGASAINSACSIENQSTTKGIGLSIITTRPTGRKFNLFGFDTNGVLEYSDTTGSSYKELAVYKFDELLQISDCNATFATANTGVYFPFVPKCDMNVSKIFYNLQSAGTDTVRVAIYSDSSNQATTLLVQSNEATTGATTTGQRSITIATTRLLAQTRYWIAIKNDNGASSFLSKNDVYSNNITREGFTSGAFVTTPSPSSSANAIWVGIGI